MNIACSHSALRREIEALRGLLCDARLHAGEGMRAAVLRWHEEQYIRHRAQSGTSPIAGAHMAAHAESIAAIRALKADNEGK